jgi:hypothetical protein
VKEKKLKEVKAYKRKIKRHEDAILAIQSVDGIAGNYLISGSADHTVRSKLKPTSSISSDILHS